ncbi:MAG: 16S rRNA (uracil(1498)-N(3))-methyltransferase [Candidatus Marinimicrobia bacterium]|jgi:16S rRNA (uracil1498-N3)-methyltransferase|nr:16S rRNA (uracil(1498)-N(3))-methyltransferase [Candidatus Neomarinimicrobiota bacterium]MBT3634330.1 16S rRNA (uracil(1498)-N(3))-methyltransferase [Candidatus Neomarinimicrobiota bacterium]MBT3681761.1 16S rRNA (uracil(1498)-N(3))-methyltransferase [Candidatus Neomarinimicrobiota bacterium]MBT3759487.1 16S rRNA (uracil(1498)-N(3))-methyltransferase [Candidatus Neomarinimicrobiota bacterium]MBT3895975.1 16S rRNA (uracil(1498)-N(3))-methyltransferase [Candidatus Neomarinimicrobiota bacterium
MNINNIFYGPDFLNGQYILSNDEAFHCQKVLRLQPEEKIFIVDGKGNLYYCNIVNYSKSLCNLDVIEHHMKWQKPKSGIHIAIAPTKNISRFEFFLEKSTEIGVTEFTPLLCRHSERTSVNINRMKKIIISAMKQSKQAILPKLNEPIVFNSFISKSNDGKTKYIAHYERDNSSLFNAAKPGKPVLILIGPEGDFTAKEMTMAKESGFSSVSLGSSRLRTETAGIAACHTLNLINDNETNKI